MTCCIKLTLDWNIFYTKCLTSVKLDNGIIMLYELLDWSNTGQECKLFCMDYFCLSENKFTIHVFLCSLLSSINNNADLIVLLSHYFSMYSLWHVRHLCMSCVIRHCVTTVSNSWLSLNLWPSRFCFSAGKR